MELEWHNAHSDTDLPDFDLPLLYICEGIVLVGDEYVNCCDYPALTSILI